MALADNKVKIQSLLAGINALPEAGSGEPAEPVLQEKTATPTKEAQSITPDAGYDGLSKVDVGAIPDEYIVPSGTVQITENGEHDVREAASVNVSVSAPEVSLQEKTVTPATTAQTVEPDSGYDGLSAVTVEKIPSDYVIPSGEKSITANGKHDVTGFASVNVAVESDGGSGANINTLNMVIEGTADYVQLGYTKATNNELVITYEDTTRTFADIAQNTFVMITVDPDEENSNAVWVDLVNEDGDSYFTFKPYVPILIEAPKAENGNTRTLRITYKHY